MDRRRIISIILILLLLIILPTATSSALRLRMQKALALVTRPIIGVYDNAGNFIFAVFHIKDVIGQANSLEAKNHVLEAQLSELKEVAVQNEALRKELDARQTLLNKKAITAQIIGRSPQATLSEITIDRGTKDGVLLNQPVVSNGYLVGIVVDLKEATSLVKLITAHNSTVPVILQSSRAVGLLKGGLRGLIVDDLPADSQINPGEQVVTERVGNFSYQGILVGEVSKIVSGKSEIFQTVSVNSPVALNRLDYVSVIVSQ